MLRFRSTVNVVQEHTIVFLALTFVLIVGWMVLFLRTVPFTGYETDGVYYMITSRLLFTDQFRPPTFGGGIGMPLLTRFVSIIVPDTFMAAKVVSLTAGLAFLIASTQVASRFWGAKIGLVTGLLLLTNPLVVIYSTTSLSDMLAAAWLMLGLWSLLDAERRWRLFLGAVCLGFAWTTRSVYFVFWPLLMAPIFRRKHQEHQDMVLAALWALTGLFVGCVYQGWVNWRFFGSPFYSDNWRNIAALVYGWDGVTQVHSAKQMLIEQGGRLAFLWLKRFAIQIPEGLFHATFWPLLLALPGYFVARRSTEHLLYYLWGLVTVAYLFLLAPVWRIELRYFLPVLPLILASGVAMWQALSGGRHRYLATTGLLFALIISLGAAVENMQEMVALQAPEYRDAGQFLASHAQPGDVVLATQPHVFFYANLPGKMWGKLEIQPIDQIGQSVEAEGIDWVVFDSRRGGWQFPQFSELLDPASRMALMNGWTPAKRIERPQPIMIWSVHP